MKILITGASGLLGRAIFAELQNTTEHEVIGCAYSRLGNGLLKMDLLDFPESARCIKKIRPDVIIHAAAERRPDISENNTTQTTLLNVKATQNIADVAKEINAWLIYISSDYVFNGECPPYFPHSKTEPINFYGKSKLEGELVIKQILNDALILRVPVLYGFVEDLDECSVTQIAKQLLQNKKVAMDNWAVRYPTFVNDIAFLINQLIVHKQKDRSFGGIKHWSANEHYTKYGMALVMAKIIGVDISLITPENNPVSTAPRPQNAKLDNSLLKEAGFGRYSCFKSTIKEIIKNFI